MDNPFEILGIKDNFTDEEIRRAYLARIKEFSPEEAPDQFREIHEAYELVKERSARIRFSLFDQDPGAETPFATLRHSQLLSSLRQPPSAPGLQEYLKECLKTQYQP